MKNILFSLSILSITVAGARSNYPFTKMADSVDNYFGRNITDHYRWIEHLEDSAVRKWFKQQGELSHSILKNISGRDALFNEFVALDKMQSTSYSDMVLIDSI